MSEIDSTNYIKGTAISTNVKAEYSSCKLWVYCLVISLGAFQFGAFYRIKKLKFNALGYALGIYSPISLVLMSLYDKDGVDWSPTNKEPYNTLVNTTLYVGAFAASMLSPFLVMIQHMRELFIRSN